MVVEGAPVRAYSLQCVRAGREAWPRVALSSKALWHTTIASITALSCLKNPPPHLARPSRSPGVIQTELARDLGALKMVMGCMAIFVSLLSFQQRHFKLCH